MLSIIFFERKFLCILRKKRHWNRKKRTFNYLMGIPNSYYIAFKSDKIILHFSLLQPHHVSLTVLIHERVLWKQTFYS